MIKLIASDLDGTLLPNGAQGLSQEAFDLIQKAGALGIQFVAASGRQYANMKRMFGPIWRDVIFIAENGSLIVRQDEVLDKTVIPQESAKELIRYLYAQDDCDVMVSDAHSVYLCPKPQSKPYVDFILYTMKNTTTIVDDLCALNEDIIKVSAIVYGDKALAFSEKIAPEWSRRFNVAVAGGQWLDFTITNKGEAIDKLRKRFSLQREEIVAFGDNFNDEAMFRTAGYSYAMLTANEQVQKAARHCCDSVENVLKNLIAYHQ